MFHGRLGFEVAVVVMRNPDVTRGPWFARPMQGVLLTNELEITNQTAEMLTKKICSYSCHLQTFQQCSNYVMVLPYFENYLKFLIYSFKEILGNVVKLLLLATVIAIKVTAVSSTRTLYCNLVKQVEFLCS